MFLQKWIKGIDIGKLIIVRSKLAVPRISAG